MVSHFPRQLRKKYFKLPHPFSLVCFCSASLLQLVWIWGLIPGITLPLKSTFSFSHMQTICPFPWLRILTDVKKKKSAKTTSRNPSSTEKCFLWWSWKSLRAEVSPSLLKQQHVVININESSFSLVLLDCFNLHPVGFSSHVLFFIQIEGLQFVRGQLCFSGLSSEVQPLPSDRTGPELQQKNLRLWSEGAVQLSAESTLWTEDSGVRHHVLVVYSD